MSKKIEILEKCFEIGFFLLFLRFLNIIHNLFNFHNFCKILKFSSNFPAPGLCRPLYITVSVSARPGLLQLRSISEPVSDVPGLFLSQFL